MSLAKDSTVRNITPTRPTEFGFPSAQINTGIISEAGIGSLMPFGGYLYFHTYPAENGQEKGTGLWRMGPDRKPVLLREVNQTDAGRIIHVIGTAHYLFMGKFRIAQDNTITDITGFGVDDRVTAWAREPQSKVLYALTMGGRLYSYDPSTNAVTFVKDMKSALGITGQAHFKAMWGVPGNMIVVSNIEWPIGALGTYNISTGTATIAKIAEKEWGGYTDEARGSHIEVAGSYYKNKHVYATGLADPGFTGQVWLIKGNSTDTTVPPLMRRFLIPLSHRQQTLGWQQEWMRIRQADTERYLMDFHGGWYQISCQVTTVTGDDVAETGYPIIEPISRHVRTNTDFCIWDGRLWLGGNQTSPQTDNGFPNAGQDQAALISYQSTDELYQLGKPQASGFFCRNKSISASSKSPWMLMRGYDKKALLTSHTSAGPVDFTIEIVNGGKVYTYDTWTTVPGKVNTFTFPGGVSADYVRISPTTAVTGLDAWVEYN